MIPSGVKSITLILVFISSLLDAQHQRDSVKNKPASLLVVPLEKAFGGKPPSLSGGQCLQLLASLFCPFDRFLTIEDI